MNWRRSSSWKEINWTVFTSKRISPSLLPLQTRRMILLIGMPNSSQTPSMWTIWTMMRRLRIEWTGCRPASNDSEKRRSNARLNESCKTFKSMWGSRSGKWSGALPSFASPRSLKSKTLKRRYQRRSRRRRTTSSYWVRQATETKMRKGLNFCSQRRRKRLIWNNRRNLLVLPSKKEAIRALTRRCRARCTRLCCSWCLTSSPTCQRSVIAPRASFSTSRRSWKIGTAPRDSQR